MRAPERSPYTWPRVSDYAVEPESGQELFDGEVREAQPAGPKHGDQHHQIECVIGAYLAPGYRASADLLTRQAVPHNFASDTSIRKKGTNPETGDRYLEELAFEIKSTQSTENLEKRARIMAARGVRRIFSIPVRGDEAGSEIIAGPVAEWIAAEERWRTYRDDEVIADPCLFEPLTVRALLDAVEAEAAVVTAYVHKKHPVVVKYGDERYRAGEEKFARESIRLIMHTRGLPMDTAAHARIDACSDLEILRRWLARAVLVASAGELFGHD